MKRGISIVRSLLWAEGACFCLGVPQVIYYLVQGAGRYESTDPKFMLTQVAIYSCLAYLFLTGLTALVAAYGMEQYRSWSGLALQAASMVNLVIVPVGTVLGAYGLWLALNPRARATLDYELASHLTRGGTLRTPGSSVGRAVVAIQIMSSLFLVPLTAVYLQTQGAPTLQYWGFMGAFMSATLVGILCHELGHVAAGIMSGFQFQTMAAGPMVVSLLSDGWRFQWVNSLGLFNGITVMSPQSPKRLRSNAFFFVIGGPLASLLCGAGGLALLLAGPRLGLGLSSEFFGILGVIELVNCLANMVPLQVPGGYTDGARLLQLIRKQPEGARFLAELAFGLSDTTTLRPKDWHEQWVKSVTEDPKSPSFSRGCYHAYVYHLDRGDTDEASIWLARCMDSHGTLRRDPYRWILAIENAYFEARHLRNVAGAKEWLSVRRAGIPAERFRVLRVKAAIHIAEGERELASEAIETAVRLHARCAETGRQQFERALLRDVQNWFDDLSGSAGLSRLAQALRERDSLIEAVNKIEDKPSPVQAIHRFLRPED